MMTTEQKIEHLVIALEMMVDGCLEMAKAGEQLERQVKEQGDRIVELEKVAHKQVPCSEHVKLC